MKWVHGKVIEGKELRDLKRRFITKESQVATKLEMLRCVRKGYRTETEREPSLYQFASAFKELLEMTSTL